MAVDFDFVNGVKFRLGDGPLGRRRSFRAIPSGVRVLVAGMPRAYTVNDISSGGLCMTVSEGLFRQGEELALDILIEDRPYLQGLSAKVVRTFSQECACFFFNLSRNQELRLDKLVLEMQKRYIARLKQEREAEEKYAPQGEDALPSLLAAIPPIYLRI